MAKTATHSNIGVANSFPDCEELQGEHRKEESSSLKDNMENSGKTGTIPLTDTTQVEHLSSLSIKNSKVKVSPDKRPVKNSLPVGPTPFSDILKEADDEVDGKNQPCENKPICSGNEPLMQTHLQDESQDVEGEPKDIIHTEEISEAAICKVSKGSLDDHTDLLYRSTALINSEDEIGIFTSEAFWFLDLNERKEILLKNFLEFGSFGSVEHDNKEFVMKKRKQNLHINEVLITATLDNPYIVKTHGLTFHQNTVTMVMDYAGISLFRYVQDAEIQEEVIWDLTFQGLSALKYLEEKKVIHHDVNPQTVLLRKHHGNLLFKLVGFGAAKLTTEQQNNTEAWTLEYLSPERGWLVLLNNYQKLIRNGNEEERITSKSDVYSLGLTMCFAYQKKHLLVQLETANVNIAHPKLRMTQANVENPDWAAANIPVNVNCIAMRKVFLKMLCGSVENRYSPGQAMKFMWELSNQDDTCTKQKILKPVPASSTTHSASSSDVMPFEHLGLNKAVGGSGTAPPKDVSNPDAQTLPSIIKSRKDWRNCSYYVNEHNVDDLPESLKSRMAKRKLKNKLPAVKKQKTQIEIQRGG